MAVTTQHNMTFTALSQTWLLAIVSSFSIHMLAANLADSKTPIWDKDCCVISDPIPFPPLVPKGERQTIYVDLHVVDNPPNSNYFGIAAHIAYLARPSETDMTEALNGLTISKPTTIDLICTAQSNGRLKDCVALTSAANPLAAPTVALYERHVRLAPLPAGSSTLPKVKLHYNWPANI